MPFCFVCKTEFTISFWKKNIFCSEECKKKLSEGHIIRYCVMCGNPLNSSHCGNPLNSSHYRLKSFCSENCKKNHEDALAQKRKNLSCLNCGMPLNPRDRSNSFCCNNCSKVFQPFQNVPDELIVEISNRMPIRDSQTFSRLGQKFTSATENRFPDSITKKLILPYQPRKLSQLVSRDLVISSLIPDPVQISSNCRYVVFISTFRTNQYPEKFHGKFNQYFLTIWDWQTNTQRDLYYSHSPLTFRITTDNKYILIITQHIFSTAKFIKIKIPEGTRRETIDSGFNPRDLKIDPNRRFVVTVDRFKGAKQVWSWPDLTLLNANLDNSENSSVPPTDKTDLWDGDTEVEILPPDKNGTQYMLTATPNKVNIWQIDINLNFRCINNIEHQNLRGFYLTGQKNIKVITWNNTGNCCIWNLRKTTRPIINIPHPFERFGSNLIYSSNYLIFFHDENVRIWDINANRYLTQFEHNPVGNTIPIGRGGFFKNKPIAISPDGKYIIIFCVQLQEPFIEIYDLLTGNRLYTFYDFDVYDSEYVIISPDNTFFIAGSFMFS